MFVSFARVGMVAAVASTAVVLTGAQVCAASAAVTGLSPTYGPIGTVVDISGAGFTGAREVRFNGTAAHDFSVDATGTDIHATVPAAATTGPVAVTASDGSVASGPTFTVQPTAVTLARSVAVVTFPARATLTAAVTSAGQPAAGQPAQLQRQVVGTTSWISTGARVTTSSSGAASWTVKPRSSAGYRVVAGSASYPPVVSPVVRISVRPLVTISFATVAPVHMRIPISGSVAPAATGTVVLDRLVGGAWRAAQTGTLNTSSRYTFFVRLPATGRYSYRVRRPADATHWSGASASGRVSAVSRTLRSGMAGPDVLALQKRLAALHYDIGAVDGHYGFDTVHAVTAFEKLQRLPRDGVVGRTVWSQLVDPRVPRPRHPLAGTAIEVDLTHQVVYYLVQGRIRRIMDSSTGGGYSYTGSDGSTQRAITPTGHFHVVYKVNHWVTSRLGTLYRPAYFNNDGYAVHGETLVPPYPASHGCVRITVPAMNRLYGKLHDGMSVWIYR